ncbi:hypothetical protein [Telluribacter sp.]|jgi:hypothetical protein|uniref:hypothetical protein n=1 Tax=Telluribacter sp. TaxID=1978767 RepID=UPI002E13E82B|nr:hypothetical protein [Telluribacter sp.]
MKKITFGIVALLVALVFSQCSVSRQIKEAKALADCKYNITSADSIYLAGIDVREFRAIRNPSDVDLARFPRLGVALLRRDVPLNLRLNLSIMNPTNRVAAVNQLEYKILLADTELFNGLLNRRIEVAPDSGRTIVPVSLNTNAYELISNPQTRADFMAMLEALSGKADAKPTVLTIQVRPTLSVGDKQVDYPGYITIKQEVTSKTFLGY